MTTTGAPADGISQTIRFGTECTEEVTRRGLLEPCEKPGVALRIDPNEGAPYVVCARHCRAEMVPLKALADAPAASDSSPGAVGLGLVPPGPNPTETPS